MHNRKRAHRGQVQAGRHRDKSNDLDQFRKQHRKFKFSEPDEGNMQLTAVMFILLLGGAYTVEAAAAINDRTQMTSKLLSSVCTKQNSFRPFNKPKIISLGARDGEIIPLSCATNNKPQCENDLRTTRFFYDTREIAFPNLSDCIAVRGKHTKTHNEWAKKFLQTTDEIRDQLDEDQKKDFDQLCFMIGKLKQFYFSEQTTKQTGVGNCAEHVNSALKDLLIHKLKFDLTLKLQLVTLDAQHAKNTNIIQDHRFILIDSHLKDTNIVQNQSAVEKQLASITEGYYCDPWNQFFAKADEVGEGEKSLYSGHGGWHSMGIQTLDLRFNKMKTLPMQAQQLICTELSAVGFPLEMLPTNCRLWRSSSEGHAFTSTYLEDEKIGHAI